MVYQFKYTTIEQIANMLPHLYLEGVAQFNGDEAHDYYGKKIVSRALIDDVAWMEEAEITRILGQIYELPLKLIVDSTKAVLAKIANNKIVAELKRRLLEQEPAPSLGSAPGTGSGSNDTIANNLLLMLTVGHNIVIPGLQTPQGFEPMQSVFLEGEVPRSRSLDTVNNKGMIFGNFKNQLTSRLGESNGVRGQEPLLRRVEDFDIYS
jgi:hypothetical protein